MNSLLTTLVPPAASFRHETILSKDGLTCSLLTLLAGGEAPGIETGLLGEHFLYVVEGQATVRCEGVNTILLRDQALLLPEGRAYALEAGPEGGAKILRVVIPWRQALTPQIVTLES
jgi:glyoxylate utilization-related uncharacterized protein